jgi:hypothetical protein
MDRIKQERTQERRKRRLPKPHLATDWRTPSVLMSKHSIKKKKSSTSWPPEPNQAVVYIGKKIGAISQTSLEVLHRRSPIFLISLKQRKAVHFLGVAPNPHEAY